MGLLFCFGYGLKHFSMSGRGRGLSTISLHWRRASMSSRRQEIYILAYTHGIILGAVDTCLYEAVDSSESIITLSPAVA